MSQLDQELWEIVAAQQEQANGFTRASALTATTPSITISAASRAEMAAGAGTKDDWAKVPLQLLPFTALTEVGKVLAFGAQKYSAHNWRHGMSWTRPLGACLRHLFAWLRGESKDPETGLSHLAHATCMLLFALEYETLGVGKDDRWKAPDVA